MNGLWTKIGQENTALVHRLSNGATYELENPVVGHLLDILCNRQALDKTWTLCHSGWAPTSHSQIPDKIWTDIELDKIWTKPIFKGPS